MREGGSPLRIGWFSTGRGPGSRRLLAAVQDEITAGSLNARIAVVFCNRSRGEDDNTDLFFAQVDSYGLPLITVSSRDFRRNLGEKPARKGEPLPDWRRAYDREVMRALVPYPFDIGLLAGYMLIFCEEAADHWDLLNLHPAEPGGPKGIWQDVIWDLIETRADRAGAMIHLATPELDEGPPVSFCIYPIRSGAFDALWDQIRQRSTQEVKEAEGEDNPLFQEIRRHGVARELPLVVETLRAFADGRLSIRDRRVVDRSGNPVPPIDLSAEVDRAVAIGR